MRQYAQGTSVSAFQSAVEIQQMLRKHGCGNLGSMDVDGRTIIMFGLGGLTYRIEAPLPNPSDERWVALGGGGYSRGDFKQSAYDAECQRLWRSMVLITKAKLVAIQDGVETFEEAFMPYIVVGGGMTLRETLLPQIKEAAALGNIPSQLALPGVTK